MSKKTYNGILKDNTKEQNYIHPQTNSRQVLTGENNNSNLQEELNAINDKFAQIKENETNKGAFASYNALVSRWEEEIANPLDRAGWTAIVEDEDKLYFYDTQENKWKPTSSGGTGSGIQSVNAKTDKNIVLTGSDINATIDSNVEKTITQHLQDIKNITNDINNELVGVKNTKINGKTLNEDVTLKAVDIQTESGASIQSHIADLDLKYNDQEIAIEELENELNPLLNKTNVLYLNNDQMFEAVNAIVDPYKNNQVVVATDDGDYKKGSVYKFNISGSEETPIYEWEEITSSGGGTVITDTLTLSKEVFVPEVPAIDPLIINVENISTAETPYGFEINANGYYESNNKGISNSYALCKVTFTLPTTTNVVFDVINYGENTYDYGIFSTIDNYLSNDYQEDTDTSIVYKSYKKESSQNVQTLKYDNVEAGTHFITIKYRKENSGDQGNDSLQFRLNEAEHSGKPSIPSDTYISSGSIKVDDYNTLQIDGKNILKAGDIAEPIKELKGTEENPIILNELDYGIYNISGKFKVYKEGTKASTLPFCTVTNKYCEVLCSIGQSASETYKRVAIRDAVAQNNYIEDNYGTQLYYSQGSLITFTIPTYTQSNTQVKNYEFSKFAEKYDVTSNSATVLTTNNAKAYTPTEDYNPATVKFVKETFDEKNKTTPTITILEDVDKPTQNELLKFSTTNTTEDNLFFYKQIGTTKVYELAKAKTNYYDLFISKSLADGTIPSSYGTSVEMRFYNANGGYNVIKIIFSFSQNTLDYISCSKGYIYENGSWTTQGDVGDYISLRNFFVGAGLNLDNHTLRTTNEFPSFIKNYWYVEEEEPLLKKIEIPLTSSGGSANVDTSDLGADINLSLDTESYVLTAQLVNKDGTLIGTQKTVDLPLESVVVNASYNNSTKEITLTLNNGNTTSFSVADLVSGLVPNNRSINGKSLDSNIELTGNDITAINGEFGSIASYLKTIQTNIIDKFDAMNIPFNKEDEATVTIGEAFVNLMSQIEATLDSAFGKIIYVTVSGYDGDDNDITFRIPAVVGLVQTYYYDNADYGGEIKVRITGMGENNATITTISKPSGVEITTTGRYVKLQDL